MASDLRREGLRLVVTEQQLQADLTELLNQQAGKLIRDKAIAFDPRYRPQEDEVFLIDPFPLPADIAAAVQRPASLARLDRDAAQRSDELKSFFGGRSAEGKAEVVFQALDRRRALAKSWSIVMRGDAFTRLGNPIPSGKEAPWRSRDLSKRARSTKTLSAT
jgi:hypothetical protein